MGPEPISYALADLTGSGQLDIVISTFAPCNGAVAGTTNDCSIYVIVLSPSGSVVWVDQLGSGSQQRVRTMVGDLSGSGTEQVVAFVRSSIVICSDYANTIVVLSGSTGAILASYSGPNGDD